MYWWKGKIERGTEIYALFKTTRNKFAEVETLIKKMHSYEVPCIVAYDISAASQSFADWITAETHKV